MKDIESWNARTNRARQASKDSLCKLLISNIFVDTRRYFSWIQQRTDASMLLSHRCYLNNNTEYPTATSYKCRILWLRCRMNGLLFYRFKRFFGQNRRFSHLVWWKYVGIIMNVCKKASQYLLKSNAETCEMLSKW